MHPEFLRLALFGSRNAHGRHLGIVAGIAVGTAMLLLLVGAFFGLADRDERSAWTNPIGTPLAEAGSIGPETALIVRVEDWFLGQPIARVDIAADPSFLLPGGLPAPRAGQYYASPALAALIAAQPPNQLGQRYGAPAGTLGPEALAGPDALVIMVGATRDALALRSGALAASRLEGTGNSESMGYQAVAAIGAIGMIFPVLLFVSIATRLGAASRAENFATLRLIGATPRQLALIAGAETLVLALIGTLAGMLLAQALRPLVALFPVNGTGFYPADLATAPLLTLGLCIGVVVIATLASLVSMARAGIGPLGATRALGEGRPRAWRLAPLCLGLVMLGLACAGAASGRLLGPILGLLLLGGFLITTFGMVVVGPLVTLWLGRLVASTARSAAGVIAANRIARTPIATFRAVSGLIIAVFMVTVFAAASSGAMALLGTRPAPDRLPADALVVMLADGATPAPGLNRVIGYAAPDAPEGTQLFAAADLERLAIAAPVTQGLVSVRLARYLGADNGASLNPEPFETRAALHPSVLIARTDGTPQGIEETRTALMAELAWRLPPLTRMEAARLGARRVLAELSVIAYAGALATVAIAGCSLALATAGAMLDRKRVLGLLRLIGMPVGQLHRVIAFETAVPLLGVLGLAVAAGYGVAVLIVETLTDGLHVGWPDPAYLVALACGALLALLAVAFALTMVRANTALASTRFE